MDELREKIAGIIIDATDRDGVNADWAACKILAIPEIADPYNAGFEAGRVSVTFLDKA